MATRYLSLPVTGSASQAITQLQSRLDGIFGRRRVDVEYVHDSVGNLVELIVVLDDSLPVEDVIALRRALGNLKERLGVALDIPVGAGGAVSGETEIDFDVQTSGTAPVGFAVAGGVIVSGGVASGPNTLHTDAGGGATGPNLLHTDGGGAATHDLSGTPVTVGLPILPTTLVLSGTIGATTETATDDGAGNFGVSTLLPAGGTVNYATGALTGVTAALDASTTLTESHTVGGSAHNLAGTPITADLPLTPGSVVLSSTISATAETVTDDGAGAFPTSTLLPSGGTINYVTGALTGTTAVIDGGVTITESHSADSALSAPQSVQFDSGAAAGEVSLGYAVGRAIGRTVSSLSWSFNLLFAPDFALNNNGVSGGQSLTLEARLLGAAGGRDIVLRWSATSADAAPPVVWGTPVFANALPTPAPTAALAIDMDAVYHELAIRVVDAHTLGVAYDGTEELFTFTETIVVPSRLEVRHVWGDALDRSFSLDNWAFSFSLGSPA